MIPRIVMALRLVCFCAFLCGAVAGAEDSKEGPPVLQPVELKVEGRLPVRIVLRASGILRSPVKFVIRKEPEFGKVRWLKQIAGDSMEVEYLPPADLAIREDTFWFACSNAKGFSSDTRAHIQIKDIGPRLKVGLTLDFPPTRVGQSSRLPLEVSNSGDQPAEGKLAVGLPWEIEPGSETYALAPGERKVVGVMFRPSKAGWSQTEIQLSGDAPATVQVRGEALDWVEVAKDPVAFVWSGEREQKAELVLSNSGGAPLDLTLEASPSLEHEPKVHVEAGTVRAVPMRWSGGTVPGGWGTLLLVSGGGMRRVVVWSLDAILSGFGPSFGFEGEGTALQARRTFTNTGGRSGTWTFRCTPPFYLSDAERLGRAEPARLPEPGPPPAPTVVAPSKKTEERASIPGFVWDPDQNRYVPARSVQKPIPQPQVEPKKPPQVVQQTPQAPLTSATQYPTELSRTLQPGESFVLHVGLSGKPPVAGSTLSANGPGLRHEEALLVKETAARQRSRLTNVATMPLAEKRPLAAPSGLNAEGAALPPPERPPLPPPVGQNGSPVLPSIVPAKKALPKRDEVPVPENLMGAFFPVLLYPGLRIKDVSSDAATIAFPAPREVTPEHLVVRYGNVVGGEGGEPVVRWAAFEGGNRRGKRVDGHIEIRLRGLAVGCVNHIDLLSPLGADGQRDKFCAMDILTPPASGVFAPRGIGTWVVAVVLTGGVCFLVVRFRRLRRG